jgi:HEAT repeat protein
MPVRPPSFAARLPLLTMLVGPCCLSCSGSDRLNPVQGKVLYKAQQETNKHGGSMRTAPDSPDPFEPQLSADEGSGAVPSRIPALITALGDKDADVRRGAARALGRIGKEAVAAVPALTEALGDENWEVREAAAQALGGIGKGAGAAVPALAKALTEDPDEAVRQNAAWALGRIGKGAEAAVPALTIAAREDEDEAVRRSAAQALNEIQRV